MSVLPAFAAAFRRKLLAQPGITVLPVCGACGRQVQPRDFGREFCRPCETERAAASEAWEAERWAEANGGPVVQHPPMFDGPEAERPFLVEDEDARKRQSGNVNPADVGTERHAIFAALVRALAITQAHSLAVPRCGQSHEAGGLRFVCQQPTGHRGSHWCFD